MNWEFFPNPGNSIEGLNHPGIETFRGNWIQSLAREMIQNSLDAHDGSSQPVRVAFRLKRGLDFGQKELLEVFRRCFDAAHNLEGDHAIRFFRVGTQVLERVNNISCLVVEDSNTLGLSGKRWDFLLKGEGAGYKGDTTSPLGSFGIGKNAAFAGSLLRTVLYSTQFVENGTTVRKFQGKSVLISHHDRESSPRRSVGYYGGAGWNGLTEYDQTSVVIPEEMRKTENGTNVLITAFPAEAGWHAKLTKGVVSNYFFAILDGKLEVEIEDGRGKTTIVTRSSIGPLFQNLVTDSTADDDFVDTHALFHCVLGDIGRDGMRKTTTSGQLQHLGHCKIWISIGEGLPRNVAIIRRPGMLICDGVRLLPGLKSLPSHWSDFSAVVVCESEEGNELLRAMEPPAHDSLEPDRLGDDAQKGQQALRELGRKIRQWLDHQMPRPEPDEIATVDELAEFFPSDEIDELTENGDEEPNPFGLTEVGSASERMPAVRSPMRPTQMPGYEFDDEGLDEGTGGTGGSSGERQTRRRGTRRTTTARRSRIGNVRMSRISDAPKKVRIGFTPEEDCIAAISLSVAAEDRSRLDNLAINSLHDANSGTQRNPDRVRLRKGKRINVSIETQNPIPANRAIIVEAALVEKGTT